MSERRGCDEAYDRALRGEFRHRGDGAAPYKEDLAAAAQSYREDAQSFAKQLSDALRQTGQRFADGFRHSPEA